MASASELSATDRVSLLKLRHADEELPLPKRNGEKRHTPKSGAAAGKS